MKNPENMTQSKEENKYLVTNLRKVEISELPDKNSGSYGNTDN